MSIKSVDERGAAAVVVAILMVVLLGLVALVIDVGRLYAEKAQLQNGADAAAFSIAQTCGADESDPLCVDDSPLAKPLANANANDAKSNVQSVDVVSANNSVEVVTGAEQAGLGANEISLFLARFLEPFSNNPAADYSKAEVAAKATAVWGYPGSGTTMLPLVFQLCDFKADGSLHWLSLKADKKEYSVEDLSTKCEIGVPGNFHMVDAPQKGECSFFYAFASITSSDPGMGKVAACAPLLKSRLGELIYFPTFDLAKGSGNTGEFRVDGWVAFRLEGFQFPSVKEGVIPSEASSKAKFGLYGSFVKSSSSTPDLDDDGTTDYGVTLVKLTE